MLILSHASENRRKNPDEGEDEEHPSDSNYSDSEVSSESESEYAAEDTSTENDDDDDVEEEEEEEEEEEKSRTEESPIYEDFMPDNKAPNNSVAATDSTPATSDIDEALNRILSKYILIKKSDQEAEAEVEADETPEPVTKPESKKVIKRKSGVETQPPPSAGPEPKKAKQSQQSQRKNLTQISKSLSLLSQKVNKALENV